MLILVVVAAVLSYLWFGNFDPPDEMPERVVVYENVPPKTLSSGATVRVMTYNIQFMAGKNYVFFYDLPDWSGPDVRPSLADVRASADGIAKMILEVDPDILLLQEVDDSAKRTGYADQLDLLQERLTGKYHCSTSTFYWKVVFVPHPKIWGPMGIKQVILSKYRITDSRRFNLPLLPLNPFIRRLSAKRAILRAAMPVDGGPELVVMNTHLEAFTAGTDIMAQQVNYLDRMLAGLTEAGKYWVLGGDLNLLPAGQYASLPPNEQAYYNPETEISALYQKYKIVPSTGDLAAQPEKWFTYWGNDPALSRADRTLDYLLYSDNLKLEHSTVRQHDTDRLSDHFPVIAVYRLQ